MRTYRILCIDDDKELAEQAAEAFTTWKKENPFEKFEAVIEPDFGAASKRLADERFDLITLDLHGAKDPDPVKNDPDKPQAGRRLLDQLRKTRFVPVIFYSGFADQIKELESPVVRVVKKGENDVDQLRTAGKKIFETGLPRLLRHIEEEQREYVWDTVDKQWATSFKAESDAEELSYLLARRLAARFSREGVKELLGHKEELARPIEYYIYPPVSGAIKTGEIYSEMAEAGPKYWLVLTPSCDFAQKKAERILLAGGGLLAANPALVNWKKTPWLPGDAEDKAKQKLYNLLFALLNNRGPERYRFLPGTFFLPDLVLDWQSLRQVTEGELAAFKHICTLDSPYREETLLQYSKYYGRLGIPDLDCPPVLKRLK